MMSLALTTRVQAEYTTYPNEAPLLNSEEGELVPNKDKKYLSSGTAPKENLIRI